jgi:hypothetical protein
MKVRSANGASIMLLYSAHHLSLEKYLQFQLCSTTTSAPARLHGPYYGATSDITIWRATAPTDLAIGERGGADLAYAAPDTLTTLTYVTFFQKHL